VPRQRRAAPAREHGERVVEARGHLFDAEHPHGGGGQLEREGEPVEAGADGAHRRRVLRGEREARARGARAGDEQLHRPVLGERGQLRLARRDRRGRGPAAAPERAGRGARRARRVRERRQRPHGLAVAAEGHAARREHGQARAGAEERVGQRGAALEHVLAVVEHEEGAPAPDGVGDRARQRVSGGRAHAERRGDGRRDVGVGGQGRELHPPDPSRERRRPAARRGPGWQGRVSAGGISSVASPPATSSPAARAATSRARRVLPAPPGPVSVR
jgi:hypothetical protein